MPPYDTGVPLQFTGWPSKSLPWQQFITTPGPGPEWPPDEDAPGRSSHKIIFGPESAPMRDTRSWYGPYRNFNQVHWDPFNARNSQWEGATREDFYNYLNAAPENEEQAGLRQQAWADLSNYFNSEMLQFMSGKDIRDVANQLHDFEPGGVFSGYNNVDPGYDPNLGQGRLEDRWLQQADRYDSILQGLEAARNKLFSTQPTGVDTGIYKQWGADDEVTDDFETNYNWLRDVAETAKKWGLDGTGRDHSRWQQMERNQAWNDLTGRAETLGIDESLYGLAERLWNPQTRAPAINQVARSVGRGYGATAPRASGYSTPWSYRNAQYT